MSGAVTVSVGIKTVGDLRAFMQANGGRFRIGGLEIRHSVGGDVDITFNGDLVTWVDSSKDDSITLNTRFDVAEEYQDVRGTLKRNQESIEELEKKLKDNANAGKVAAYESILSRATEIKF